MFQFPSHENIDYMKGRGESKVSTRSIRLAAASNAYSKINRRTYLQYQLQSEYVWRGDAYIKHAHICAPVHNTSITSPLSAVALGSGVRRRPAPCRGTFPSVLVTRAARAHPTERENRHATATYRSRARHLQPYRLARRALNVMTSNRDASTRFK